MSVDLSVCLCVEKNEVHSFYLMFVENSHVSIGEHQFIRLSIEGNENKMCMKIMDDLSENAAARKWSCNKGSQR